MKHFFLLLSLILLGACSPNTLYRSNFQVCTLSHSQTCEKATVQVHNARSDKAFQLGFVEFDDQGQLRSRVQMQTVVDHYAELAGQDDVLLVVFAHGWHHSAAPQDSNIKSFQGMLEKLSEIESLTSAMDKRRKRHVLGVYIGWRGDSMTIPYLNDITFWGRKEVAHDVGLHGVPEVLLRLEELVNVRVAFEETEPKPIYSRMVVIGHSFGGAVVFTSLQQILADRYLRSWQGKNYSTDAQGFGHLVVLMNPAFEAMRYSTLYDLSQNCQLHPLADNTSCRRYFASQLPRLAILTSEADMATRRAFPAGRFFSTLFETHDDIERYRQGPEGAEPFVLKEAKADKTAVGHFAPYQTHLLTASEHRRQREAAYNYRNLQQQWSTQAHGGALSFEHTRLSHLAKGDPLNPYLNIYVDKALIPNHNDIWGNEVVGFLHDLITISTLPDTKAETGTVQATD